METLELLLQQHQQVWSKYASTLEHWVRLNDSLAKNEGKYTKEDHDSTAFLLWRLDSQLDDLNGKLAAYKKSHTEGA